MESAREGERELVERARGVFDRMTDRLPWRVVLTRAIVEFVATFDPERGVREFPPGTPADGTGRHLWA